MYSIHHKHCKTILQNTMKCGREMKNMQNRTLAFVPLKFAIGVKQSKCSMHAVVIANKDNIEFSRVQCLQCPNGFDKYVVTDITVKLNSSAIKPILIKPKILMSGSSLCYPVWCLDDRNFSSLFGTITPTQALETWDKASWLKEKVPYKLWQSVTCLLTGIWQRNKSSVLWVS